MRFPPHVLDEIRSRLPVSTVVGRKVALKKKGREWAGLSPFKVEKTPSFFVNDQKGFYHCFASGEHGDIFKFLMVMEGLSFPEAVERLAEEAGVVLPKTQPRDLAREDQRQRLYALVEASAAYFQEQIRSREGAEARDYLDRRGLRRDTLGEFRIGYAPQSRGALKAHLTDLGFTAEEMATAGMLIAGEDIPEPYDRFRHRVMFPIEDTKGRVIAFGGRALDSNAPAKYLNSPETPLFHKGYVLFNAHRARPKAFDAGRIIVVEGYMDAVALCEAGFGEVVAPLGTALTDDQIKVLWRMADEPILCFDGDSAGQKAAYRAVDTVLPHLVPGKSLTFAFLPNGLDPDDLIRQQGAEAMEAVLARARPLVEVLLEREFSQGDWSTPERRAQLEKQLRDLVGKIPDGAIRSHYQRAVSEKLASAWGHAAKRGGGGGKYGRQGRPVERDTVWRPAGGGPASGARRAQTRAGGGGSWPDAAPKASESLKKSALAAGDGAALPYREALLLRAMLNHPWLAVDHAEEVAALPMTAPALSRLRDAILSVVTLENNLDSAALRSHLSRLGADRTVNLIAHSTTHRCDRFAEPDAGRAEVEDGWRHALALHDRQVGLRQSLEAAERAWHEDRSDEAFARICEIQARLARMSMPEALDQASEDI